MVRRLLAILGLTLLLWSCSAPAATVRKSEEFTPRPERETLYVVPFTTVMVPAEVEELIFDEFVDALNEGLEGLDYEFIILKEQLEEIDPEWLAGQYYLTGEIFGYIEDSGCCSTIIRLNSRIQLHQPGQDEPTLKQEYPREVFFDHDYSTLEQERRKLARDVAETHARRLLSSLAGR